MHTSNTLLYAQNFKKKTLIVQRTPAFYIQFETLPTLAKTSRFDRALSFVISISMCIVRFLPMSKGNYMCALRSFFPVRFAFVFLMVPIWECFFVLVVWTKIRNIGLCNNLGTNFTDFGLFWSNLCWDTCDSYDVPFWSCTNLSGDKPQINLNRFPVDQQSAGKYSADLF